jgi:hypothetical protein
MPGFTIRVEMHRASEAQYARLHADMARASYLRTIVGNDGKTYVLPTAEYRIASTNWTAAQVLEEVRRIANAIQGGSWVFVTQGDLCTWYTREARS